MRSDPLVEFGKWGFAVSAFWGFAVSSAVVRRATCFSSVVAIPTRQLVAPAGSYRSGGGGDETVEAFEKDMSPWRCSEPTGRNASERRAGLDTTNVDADPAT